ncbi:MAG: hypothetical protein JKY15_05100 [Deltaproteobacteria bacterium]|nr:hypothetical protein [Deltaproteobacteria bacterium]
MRIVIVSAIFLASFSYGSERETCSKATIVWKSSDIAKWHCEEFVRNRCERGACTDARVTTIGNETTWECVSYRDACGACFAPGTVVYREGTPIRIDQLQVGDIVDDGLGSTSKVVGFFHREDDTDAEMLQIYSNRTPEPVLVVSPKHLLSNEDGSFIFADKFVPGTSLKLETGNVVTVGKVEKVLLQGLYAPITESGTLLVGKHRIIASCYAHATSHDLSHFYARWIYAGANTAKVSPGAIQLFLLQALKGLGMAE